MGAPCLDFWHTYLSPPLISDLLCKLFKTTVTYSCTWHIQHTQLHCISKLKFHSNISKYLAQWTCKSPHTLSRDHIWIYSSSWTQKAANQNHKKIGSYSYSFSILIRLARQRAKGPKGKIHKTVKLSKEKDGYYSYSFYSYFSNWPG